MKNVEAILMACTSKKLLKKNRRNNLMIKVENYPNAYREVYEILKLVPKEDLNKIPVEFLQIVKKNMNKNYDFSINLNIDFVKEQEILKSQYKAMQAVNTEMIYMYWNIGKIISDNAEWGNKFIENLSIDLKTEFPEIQGFSSRNLRNMRNFYKEYPNVEILQTLSAKLPWSHNVLLISKIKDMEIRKWYMKETIKNGWSHDVLADQIKYKLYERQAIVEKVTNFENTLPDVQSALKDINKPVGVSEYKLLQDIPEYLQSQLPKVEDIELHIKDIEEIEEEQDDNE